jgi:hypothetical protein
LPQRKAGSALQAAHTVIAKAETDLLQPTNGADTLANAYKAFSDVIEAIQQQYMSGQITANEFLKRLKVNGYSHHDAKAELRNVNETMNYIGTIPSTVVDIEAASF